MIIPNALKEIERAKKYLKEDCTSVEYIGYTKKPEGKKQESDVYKHEYVNQTTNGGYFGDEFAGEVYIPIKRGLYLIFYYYC